MAAATAPSEGTGITLTYTGITGNLISVTPPNVTREMIDTTHQGTTGAYTQMAAALYRGGNCTFTLQFDPTTLIALQTMGVLSGSCVITFATNKTITFNMSIVEASVQECTVGALMTIQFVGACTAGITGASA